MNGAVVAIIVMIAYTGAYFIYARYLGSKILKIDPGRKTPAHEFRDNVDFIPTNRYVLFGHHFASIAGAAPIVGPAIAVIYGWLPALLWVLFGTVFLGAVHDFSSPCRLPSA